MKVHIKLGMKPQESSISIDGVELNRVTELNVSAGVDCIPMLTLVMFAEEIEIEGETKAEIWGSNSYEKRAGGKE